MIFLNPLWLLIFAVLRLVLSGSVSVRWKAALIVPAAAACFVAILGLYKRVGSILPIRFAWPRSQRWWVA